MYYAPFLVTSLVIGLSTQTFAAGLYPKGSAVLQVDAKSYDKLIAKSNYTSIVEFYAPWCGHCKNLQPAYEKAASSLSGYAKVAAINCDDDSNKPFCGSMGVTGFPTLKIVKPSKKAGGKPVVQDYAGERTAKAINEAMKDKIPNHVAKLKDADLESWLKMPERPKAVFFTEKGIVSPLVKALAIDFLGAIDVAQIKSNEEENVRKFEVESFPQAYMIPKVNHAPEKYGGEMKKGALKEFLAKFAAPNPEFPVAKPKAKSASSQKDTGDKPKPSAKKKAAGEGASCPAGHTGENPHIPPSQKTKAKPKEEKIEEEAEPTESSSSEDASQTPSPVSIPSEPVPAPPLEALVSEAALDKSCLNPRFGTCVLAVQLASVDEDADALTGLGEIAHKHALRRAKLFPFFSVPSVNTAGQTLLSKLGAKSAGENKAVILAVNPKKAWWTQYDGSNSEQAAIETWIDNIRFGDFKKQKLPEGIVKILQDPAKDATEGATGDNAKHDEL